jgi:hypothetical protein
VKDRKPNINDRIDNDVPDIRRDNKNDIPDTRHYDPSEERSAQQMNIPQHPNRNSDDRFNQQERINQQKSNQINQQRINQERQNQQQDYRIERKDNNSYQNRTSPNVNQQPVPHGWQHVQQMPQHRVQSQSDIQYPGGGRRKN